MPDHKLGSSFSFAQLLKAYEADEQGPDDAHFLLYRGQDILALCLRYKFNPDPQEVWVGNSPVVAEWGKKLSELKTQRTLPVYYSQRGRTLYDFKGQHLITGDAQDEAELKKRKSPVPLSRVVFLKPLQLPKAP